MVSSVSDVGNFRQQLSLTRVGLYVYKLGSCTSTYLCWKLKHGAQDWCYRLAFMSTGSVHSVDVPSSYFGEDIGEHCHSPAETLPRHVPMSCKHLS